MIEKWGSAVYRPKHRRTWAQRLGIERITLIAGTAVLAAGLVAAVAGIGAAREDRAALRAAETALAESQQRSDRDLGTDAAGRAALTQFVDRARAAALVTGEIRVVLEHRLELDESRADVLLTGTSADYNALVAEIEAIETEISGLWESAQLLTTQLADAYAAIAQVGTGADTSGGTGTGTRP